MTDEERKRLRAVCDRLAKINFEVAHAISEFEALAYPGIEAEEPIEIEDLQRMWRDGIPWREPTRHASVISEDDAPPELRDLARLNDVDDEDEERDAFATGGGSSDFAEAQRRSDEAVWSNWRDE